MSKENQSPNVMVQKLARIYRRRNLRSWIQQHWKPPAPWRELVEETLPPFRARNAKLRAEYQQGHRQIRICWDRPTREIYVESARPVDLSWILDRLSTPCQNHWWAPAMEVPVEQVPLCEPPPALCFGPRLSAMNATFMFTRRWIFNMPCARYWTSPVRRDPTLQLKRPHL